MTSAARILLIVLCASLVATRGFGVHVHLHGNHDDSAGMHGHVVSILGDVHHDASGADGEPHVALTDLAVRATDAKPLQDAFLAFAVTLIVFVLLPRARPPRLTRARDPVPLAAPFALLPPAQGPPVRLHIA